MQPLFFQSHVASDSKLLHIHFLFQHHLVSIKRARRTTQVSETLRILRVSHLISAKLPEGDRIEPASIQSRD